MLYQQLVEAKTPSDSHRGEREKDFYLAVWDYRGYYRLFLGDYALGDEGKTCGLSSNEINSMTMFLSSCLWIIFVLVMQARLYLLWESFAEMILMNKSYFLSFHWFYATSALALLVLNVFNFSGMALSFSRLINQECNRILDDYLFSAAGELAESSVRANRAFEEISDILSSVPLIEPWKEDVIEVSSRSKNAFISISHLIRYGGLIGSLREAGKQIKSEWVTEWKEHITAYEEISLEIGEKIASKGNPTYVQNIAPALEESKKLNINPTNFIRLGTDLRSSIIARASSIARRIVFPLFIFPLLIYMGGMLVSIIGVINLKMKHGKFIVLNTPSDIFHGVDGVFQGPAAYISGFILIINMLAWMYLTLVSSEYMKKRILVSLMTSYGQVITEELHKTMSVAWNMSLGRCGGMHSLMSYYLQEIIQKGLNEWNSCILSLRTRISNAAFVRSDSAIVEVEKDCTTANGGRWKYIAKVKGSHTVYQWVRVDDAEEAQGLLDTYPKKIEYGYTSLK